MIIDNFTLVVFLGLASLYSIISVILIYSAVARITGKELKHMMVTLLLTVSLGFFFGFFQLLRQVGFLDKLSQTIVDFVSNFFLFGMFVLLLYLSFNARELGKRFGFKKVGNEIKNKLQSKYGRKHSFKRKSN